MHGSICYTPQGTANAYTQNTVARIIFAVVLPALHSDRAVFVAVKALFVKILVFLADVDQDLR